MPTQSNEEPRIRERLDRWVRALRAKDLDSLMALYAPDTVTFDLMPPHQVNGTDHYRKNFERWFAAMPAPINYEMHDWRVIASDEVAFCHGLSHVRSTRSGGEQVDYWVRVTVGLQRRNGEWMMIHDHVSMPVDMQTRRAVERKEQE